MKPDSYEVIRDAKGKATAVPVFDQPYGTLDRFGRVSKVKFFPDGLNPQLVHLSSMMVYLMILI